MWKYISSFEYNLHTLTTCNNIGQRVLGLIVTVIVNVNKQGGGCELWIFIHSSKWWGKAVRMMGEAVGATWFEELTWSSENAASNSCSIKLKSLYLTKNCPRRLEKCRIVRSRKEPGSRSQYKVYPFGVFGNLMVDFRNKSTWPSLAQLVLQRHVKIFIHGKRLWFQSDTQLHSADWNQPQPVIQTGALTGLFIPPVSEKSRGLISLCRLVRFRTEKNQRMSAPSHTGDSLFFTLRNIYFHLKNPHRIKHSHSWDNMCAETFEWPQWSQIT